MMGRVGKKNELVVSRVRIKTPRWAQEGNRKWVALFECVSATGKRFPAFYIYAGATHYAGRHREVSIDAETVFAYTDNGWTKDRIGLEYLKNRFDKYAIPSKSGAVRLLLCENHSSHDTYEFKEYCIEHNIALS